MGWAVAKRVLQGMLLGGILFVAQSQIVHAQVLQSIKIEGNHRIENESILHHTAFKIGEQLDPSQLNGALKALFDTNLFSDVNIEHKAGVITIRVAENPIINRVVFEGNRRLTDDALKTEIYLKPRDVFTKGRVQADTLRILSLYRRQGRFAATVQPKLIKLEQNRVDLVFEIKEGPATGVKKIFFVGNEKFHTSKLHSVIRTKETRWYRFLTSDDNYDPERIAYDRELMRVHYLQHGYVDFKVLSSVAELSPDKSGFFITFTIEEGKRYKVGELKVTSRLKDVSPRSLRKLLALTKGDWFNGSLVEKTIDKMTDELGNQGYAFVSITPQFNKRADGKVIDITFEISEGPRVYIGQIDVHGNLATYDKVIRREFRLAEGDAYNASKLRRSEQRLHNLDFFSAVTVEKEHGDAPDKVNLKVDVKEKSTGEISLAGGITSVEGLIGNVRFKEGNFMGKGQELSSEFTVSRRTREFDVSFTEPYFLDKNISADIDLFKTRSDQLHQSGYIHNRHGGTLRTGYHITEPLVQQFWYTLREDNMSHIKSEAPQAIQKQKGIKLTSLVGQRLLYDKRDSRIDPTQGYFLSLSNEYAGLGGNIKFLRHTAEGKVYFPLADEVVFSLRSTSGVMQKMGGEIRIIDRFFLGGETLRGFEYFGVSPRETSSGKEGMGGRYSYTGSAELAFPLGLPNELGIKGSFFSDVGSVWKSDQNQNIDDSKKLRASVGFGIAWSSPLGPIRLDIAKALKYESFDQRQTVLFSFRTTF